MEKIASFQVNHTCLQPGIYLSRQDKDKLSGAIVSTFDIRFTAPNKEPVIDMPALHTIEHLGATFLRNSESKEDIVYFGPMGCRTGFYLVVFGEKNIEDIFCLINKMCNFILKFQGNIPGASPEECGNYLEQNLAMAKYYIKKFQDELLVYHRTEYPTV